MNHQTSSSRRRSFEVSSHRSTTRTNGFCTSTVGRLTANPESAQSVITADSQVVGEGVPSVAREDVATHLSIDAQSLVGFSFASESVFPNDTPRTYAAYAVLNDGTLVILQTGGESNIVTKPAIIPFWEDRWTVNFQRYRRQRKVLWIIRVGGEFEFVLLVDRCGH